jgi:Lrp/AsnC family transcriptional regulator
MERLDSFDFSIMGVLQQDASLGLAEVGERVNLSQNACWRRIKQLENAGYIRRRVALLDPELLGMGTTVFVMILAEHSEEWLISFAEAISTLPEITEVYRMSGDVDYLMKVRVRDIAHYDQVYKALIKRVRMKKVSSFFAMEEMKYTTQLPIIP